MLGRPWMEDRLGLDSLPLVLPACKACQIKTQLLKLYYKISMTLSTQQLALMDSREDFRAPQLPHNSCSSWPE